MKRSEDTAAGAVHPPPVQIDTSSQHSSDLLCLLFTPAHGDGLCSAHSVRLSRLLKVRRGSAEEMIRRIPPALYAKCRRTPAIPCDLAGVGAGRVKVGGRRSIPMDRTLPSCTYSSASRHLSTGVPHRRFHECMHFEAETTQKRPSVAHSKWSRKHSGYNLSYSGFPPQKRRLSFSTDATTTPPSALSGAGLLNAEEIARIKKEITSNSWQMNPQATDSAVRLLRQLIQEQIVGNFAVGLDAEFINGTLNSYRVLSEKAADQARNGGKQRPDASFARKADDLLAVVEQGYERDPALSPDTKSYSIVVDTHAKIGDPEGAEAVLRRLEKLWKAGNAKVKPNTILYNTVINAWARSGKRDAPKRAEAILQHMDQLNQQGHEDVCPNTICYNAVINAWAKSRESGAAQRAEAILNHMLKMHESGREGCCPNTRSFNTVIDAWSKSREKDAPKRAEELLSKMEELHQQGYADVRPDTISYNAVINTWAKSRDKVAPRRAEALLSKVEELHQQGHEDIRPDTISYNAVINAWAKSRGKGAAQRAEAILNHMVKVYEGGREGCCPNTRSFNTVIDAWAKSREKDAPKRAEELLSKMEELHQQGYADVRPDTISYNAVINTWAKSREEGAAHKAEAILNHLQKLYEDGREGCSPNTTSFTTVIDTWSKSRDKNAYDRATRIFQQMKEMDKAAEPNTFTYNSLVNALAVSSVPDKATKAFDMLLEMEMMAKEGNRNVAPDVFTYGAVMKACARTSGNQPAKRTALRVALGAFDKLRGSSHLSVDSIIYDPLFTTIANASKGQEYAKLVTQVFKLCCGDGVLNDFILRNLRRRAPRDVFETLVGCNGNVKVSDLPREWSRNNNARRQ